MRRLLFFALLVAGIARADELRVDSIRESLTGTHLHYQQFIDGIRVVGGERVEWVDHAGRRAVHESLAQRPPAFLAPAAIRSHQGELVYLNLDGQGRLAIREISEERPLQRWARYYDAATGALLQSNALFYRASARVFDPNPVAKLNDPSLQDQNDSAGAVPDAAYSVVELLDLPPSGPMIGPNVQIVDTEAPFTERADASKSLMFDRSQPQFEEVNAYFHIDRSQRYLQSLGYTGSRRIVGYSIPVDAHAGRTDNSFYVSGDVAGEGALYFGDGGTDDGEDSDIMLHEFGHAIHDWIAPGAFSGTSKSEARALSEGFGDYWSFSSNYIPALPSGRDPFCIGDWDARCWNDASGQNCGYPAGSDCLRRVDSIKTMADFIPIDSSGIEHLNGEIWSSALREIFLGLTSIHGVEQGRRLADTIVLEGLFGTPSNPTFAGQARKLLDADRALYAGVDETLICRAMTVRGILSAGDCGTPPRGEITLFQSITSSIHIGDQRAVDELFPRVQIDGGQAGTVRVTLIGPDGTSVLLSTSARADATYGLDAIAAESLSAFHNHSAAGDWKVVVTGGALRSWSLMIHFAGDTPLAVRPTTTSPRKHIAAVAHTAGVAGTSFVTDVWLFNRSDFTASLTAIFTPSGADGSSQFDAVGLNIEPHRVMVLNDVVRATMQTSGIGQLELLGDTDRVIVTSRTYTPSGDSTYGQAIPSFDSTDAGAGEIAPLQNSPDARSNIGLAEVGGSAGTVRFTFFDADGVMLGSSDFNVAPFGHMQTRLPVVGLNLRADVSVVSGNPSVLAYGSVVDNLSGDAIYLPAVHAVQPAETVAVPIIHAPGAGGTNWRTDVWQLSAAGKLTVQSDAAASRGVTLGALFMESGGAVVSSRTYTTSAQGTYGQFVPAIRRPGSSGPQQLVGVTQSPRFRTNVGLVNFANEEATATVIVYDAAGREAGRTVTVISPRSLQQLPLAAITATTLMDGRIEVTAPSGAVAAYASVIDNGSEDPSLIIGQF